MFDEPNDGHALFAPSAAKRWIECPGSIRAQEGLPNVETPYAREGTECHDVAAMLLDIRIKQADDKSVTETEMAAGAAAYNKLTDEQAEITDQYVDYCAELYETLREKGMDPAATIETRCRAPEIDPDFHGTADFTIVAGKTLAIVDLKAGHMDVPIFDPKTGKMAEQLASYALLRWHELGMPSHITKIRLAIVQPRTADEPKVMWIDIEELFDFELEVRRAIDRIRYGDETRKAGSWCKFCLAAGRCPELRDKANDDARMAFGGGKEVVRNYTNDELSAIADEAETIKAHYDGVLTQIHTELERGRKVPGYKLVNRRPRGKWHDEEFTRDSLSMYGVLSDDMVKHELRTPKQVSTILRKRGYDPKTFLAGSYDNVSSGTTAVRDTDERDEVTPQPFDNYKGAENGK